MADNYLRIARFGGGSSALFDDRIGYNRTDTLIRLVHATNMDDTAVESLHLADDSTSYQNTSGKTAYAIVIVQARTDSGDRAYKLYSAPTDNSTTSATNVFDSADLLVGSSLFDANADALTSWLVPITNNHYIVLENTSGASPRNIAVNAAGVDDIQAVVIELA